MSAIDLVETTVEWTEGDQVFVDALRYRRLRTLGCAPDASEQLEAGNVLRFTNLDDFVDRDRAETERNDSAGAKPTIKPRRMHLLYLPRAADTITRLQAALKPFVRHYEFKWMDERPDEAECCIYSRVTYGQLREAVAALSSVGGE